jgi:Ca2+/H+ antiporter
MFIQTTDLFEVAVVIGACFIVNYVTADAKTNYAEGFAMVAFYFMVVGLSICRLCASLTLAV